MPKKDNFMKPNVDLTKNAMKEGLEYSMDRSDYCDLEEEKNEEYE